MILLSPIAVIVLAIYLGFRDLWCWLILGVLAIVPGVIIWPISVIIGICFWLRSDENFIKYLHYKRDHKQWVCSLTVTDPKYCDTGECRYLPK